MRHATPTKLCTGCRFFQPSLQPAQCLHEGNEKAPDYVSGGTVYEWHTAQNVREDAKLCSPNGNWFEARESEQAAA